jgi:drug/metabolite transporter (DMT)-like permease
VRCGLAALLFGVSAPLAARLTDDMGAFTLAGLLYIGAALAVLPWAVTSRPSVAAMQRSAPRLSIAVLLGGAVGPVLLAFGLGLVSPATSSLLLNLELVFTTLVAGFVFREHIGRHVLTGTGFVLTGTVVLSAAGAPELRWGAVLFAGACLCWAVDNSVTAGLDQIAPSHITFVKGVVAGGANLTIGLIVSEGPPVSAVLWALVIGGFGYGASITLWVSGARDLGAARGQLVFATAPFIGAIVAWSVLSDPVTLREAVAFALGVTGVSFVLRSGHDHAHEHDEMEHEHEHRHDDGHHDHDHDHDGEPVEHARVTHTHVHRHEPVAHSHPHVPDLHHRHGHDRSADRGDAV